MPVDIATAARVMVRMEDARDSLQGLWPESYQEKMRSIVQAVRTIAEKTGREPFEVATSEATRAGKEGKAGVALQLAAAAVEIAEGKSPALNQGDGK